MQVYSVSGNSIGYLGARYKLTNETIKHLSSTKLTYKEMTTSSLEHLTTLMKQRGVIKEPNKFKQWVSDKYKQIGEKLGLLKKECNIYTDIC